MCVSCAKLEKNGVRNGFFRRGTSPFCRTIREHRNATDATDAPDRLSVKMMRAASLFGGELAQLFIFFTVVASSYLCLNRLFGWVESMDTNGTKIWADRGFSMLCTRNHPFGRVFFLSKIRLPSASKLLHERLSLMQPNNYLCYHCKLVSVSFVAFDASGWNQFLAICVLSFRSLFSFLFSNSANWNQFWCRICHLPMFVATNQAIATSKVSSTERKRPNFRDGQPATPSNRYCSVCLLASNPLHKLVRSQYGARTDVPRPVIWRKHADTTFLSIVHSTNWQRPMIAQSNQASSRLCKKYTKKKAKNQNDRAAIAGPEIKLK